MNVLVDYIGHGDLFYSMHALFEKRLGWNLFRPSDDDGKWIAHGIKTFHNGNDKRNGSKLWVTTHDFWQHSLTFDEFLDTRIDIAITTFWQNEEPWANLMKKMKPGAKVIRQIANILERPTTIPNIMLATTEPMPNWVNGIQYIPEHPDTYSPDLDLEPSRSIKSFFSFMPSFPQEMKTWESFQRALPDFSFKMHGGNGVDGSVPQRELPDVLRDSMFVWHTKPHGGCGYTARQALACGKPLIIKGKYPKMYNTLAQHYMADGVNSIDLDNRSLGSVVDLIRSWAHPSNYRKRCEIVLAEYNKHINFAQEATRVEQWLQRI